MRKLVYLILALVFFIGLNGCADEQVTLEPTTSPVPTETKPTEDTPSLVSDEAVATARRLVNLLVQEDFEAAVGDFDSTMVEALPPEKLAEVWNTLISQVGRYQEQVGVRTEKRDQYDIIFVTAQFEQAALDVQVVLNQEGQVAGLFFLPAETSAPAEDYRPPAYAQPDLFREIEVTVGSGEWELPGTLALPQGDGPFPAVVLVHGSGPHDRDETIGPNQPFRDLAWGLASQGIAVLRYEKRTKEYGAKMAAALDQITVKEETVDDALAAVSLLREREEINRERIFVLGHSLGGTLAPQIGAADPSIAGLIIMAGATRPLEELILDQMQYLFNLDGSVSEAEQTQLAEVERQIAAIDELEASQVTTRTATLLGSPAGYWLDLRDYHPAEMAATLNQPLLILQGERDYQVTMADLGGWQQALTGREDVTIKVYPDLNHLFMPGEGPSTPAEYRQLGHVAEPVIGDIASWVKNL